MTDRYMVIRPDTLEEMRRAGHAAKLEARIEKLEAALRKYADEEYNGFNADGAHARKALEEKE